MTLALSIECSNKAMPITDLIQLMKDLLSHYDDARVSTLLCISWLILKHITDVSALKMLLDIG